MEKIEYRVRPVTRYIVTRYQGDGEVKGSGAVGECGRYDNADLAYEVAYALCRAEHERLGYPPEDMRIIYPTHPDQPVNAVGNLSVTLCANTEQLEESLARVQSQLSQIASTAERASNAMPQYVGADGAGA